MSFYVVKYTIGRNNERVYPGGVAGVIWKTSINNPIENTMVGDTLDEVNVDGNEVVALEPAEAERLIKEYCTKDAAAPVPGE